MHAKNAMVRGMSSNLHKQVPPSVSRRLVLDELFDLTLYKRMRVYATGETAAMIDRLIPVEKGHYMFWREFFGAKEERLDIFRRIKLWILILFSRIFGEAGIHLVLESIEIYGVRKYLRFWNSHRNTPLGDAVRNVLIDEFQHEDEIVSKSARRKVHPERVRVIFLGFNDGLVEILGAVAGFFAAFNSATSVLAAGFTVAVAGSISMSSGVFAAFSSGNEIEEIENGKKEFLGGLNEEKETGRGPVSSAVVVGVFYFIGAMVPVLPVLFGATTVFASIAAGVVVAGFVSYIVAILSGMRVIKRIATNLIVIAVAVTVTYSIGIGAREILGLDL